MPSRNTFIDLIRQHWADPAVLADRYRAAAARRRAVERETKPDLAPDLVPRTRMGQVQQRLEQFLNTPLGMFAGLTIGFAVIWAGRTTTMNDPWYFGLLVMMGVILFIAIIDEVISAALKISPRPRRHTLLVKSIFYVPITVFSFFHLNVAIARSVLFMFGFMLVSVISEYRKTYLDDFNQ